MPRSFRPSGRVRKGAHQRPFGADRFAAGRAASAARLAALSDRFARAFQFAAGTVGGMARPPGAEVFDRRASGRSAAAAQPSRGPHPSAKAAGPVAEAGIALGRGRPTGRGQLVEQFEPIRRRRNAAPSAHSGGSRRGRRRCEWPAVAGSAAARRFGDGRAAAIAGSASWAQQALSQKQSEQQAVVEQQLAVPNQGFQPDDSGGFCERRAAATRQFRIPCPLAVSGPKFGQRAAAKRNLDLARCSRR